MHPYRPRIAVTTHRHEIGGEMCIHPGYTESVLRAGGIPIVLPLLSDAALYHDALALFDGFLLTGSEADVFPERYGKTPPPGNFSDLWRDEQDFVLLQHAETTGKPVFGICRGCQVMNVHRGGTLALHYSDLLPTTIQHDHEDHVNGPPAHAATLSEGTRIASLIPERRVMVNSLHRQVCERLGDRLRPAAIAEDGFIEAIEDTERPACFYAVQWHPERSPGPPDELSRALFAQLIREASAWRAANLERAA